MTCSSCGADFERAPGRDLQCRDCLNARSRARYAADAGVRERAKTNARAAAAANPEAYRRAAAAWVRANPEKRAAALARYRERHPDKPRSDRAIRRARQRGAHVEHVEALVVLERADGVCGICGEDVDPLDFHVDHVVPLARGGEHSYANTQPAHPRCNKSKGAR